MRNFTIAGHLGSDPKSDAKGETNWTTLRVATNDGRSTHWFWVTAFGKLAEAIAGNLVKGDGIAIRGELRVNKHNDRERVELIAQEADFFPKSR